MRTGYQTLSQAYGASTVGMYAKKDGVTITGDDKEMTIGKPETKIRLGCIDLNDIVTRLENLERDNKELRAKVWELEESIKCIPGGAYAESLKKEFEKKAVSSEPKDLVAPTDREVLGPVKEIQENGEVKEGPLAILCNVLPLAGDEHKTGS